MTLDADFWWLSPAADPDALFARICHTDWRRAEGT